MKERHDFELQPAAAPFMPLWRAAAVALERLFPERPARDARLLDVMALALSSLMPIYRRELDSGSLCELSEALLAAGRFSGGALQLEFADGRSPIAFLVVSRRELESALGKLRAAAPEAGRVSLTLRQCGALRRL